MKKKKYIGISFAAILCILFSLYIFGQAKTSASATHEVSAVSGCSAKELQALLDLNKDDAYEHLIINIPAGTYQLDRTLYISSNTTIKASQQAYFEKQDIYGAMLEGRVVNDKGGYGACKNITVEGGVWDSKAVIKEKTGTETFRFIHCSGVTIRDAQLCNVPEGSHLIVFSGTQEALVENCKFYGYGDGLGGKSPKEAIQLDVAHDVKITPTFQEIKWDDLPCRAITVTGCEFYDYSRAFGSHTAVKGIYHDNIVFKNNSIKNMSDTAVKLFNYTNTTISGNTVENCGWGIFIYTFLDVDEEDSPAFLKPLKKQEIVVPDDFGIQVKNNTIRNTKNLKQNFGDAVRVLGSKEVPVAGVKISDNTFEKIERYGVFATYAPEIVISNNKFLDTKENGILIEEKSTDAAVLGNKVQNAAGLAAIGIYSGSDRAAVYGNEIVSPKGAGIYLYSKVSSCTIGSSEEEDQRNRILKPGTTGIHISNGCDSNTVEGNDIEQAGDAGIWVYDSKKNIISENEIVSPKKAGIHITKQGKNNIVSGNKVTKAGTDGIRLHDSAECEVSSNTIVSPKVIGINLTGKSDQAILNKNQITSAGEDGIWISGSLYCTVTSNIIKKYAMTADKNYGIGIYQSGGTKSSYVKIEKNTIVGSGKKTMNNAIHVNGSDYVSINKNTIKTPAGSGIYIYTSKYSKITSNKITKPIVYGIYVTTDCDKAQIKSNTVTTPGNMAIMTYQAKNSAVTSNKITVTDKVAGIRISQSDNTTIESNTITGASDGKAVWITGSTGCKESENIIK